MEKTRREGGVANRGQELDLRGSYQKQLGPWREGLSGGNGAMLETKPLLEIPSNAERAKGRGILASFSLLSFSLPPKSSWSQLARESGKVVCKGSMRQGGWGNGSNYK